MFTLIKEGVNMWRLKGPIENIKETLDDFPGFSTHMCDYSSYDTDSFLFPGEYIYMEYLYEHLGESIDNINILPFKKRECNDIYLNGDMRNVFKTEAYKHQQEAFDISKNKKWFAFHMEQRTGKTKLAIDTASYLFLNREIDTMIILAPNIVNIDWITEGCQKHMSVEYNPFIYNLRKKESIFDLTKEFSNKKKINVFTMNFESINTKKGIEFLNHMFGKYRSLLIIDESHNLKSHKGIRFKTLKRMLEKNDNVKYRRLLTGTPLEKNVADLWSQFYLLNPDILGFKTYSQYEKFLGIYVDYFNGRNYFQQIKKVDDVSKETIINRIREFTYRKSFKDCFNIQDEIYIVKEVSLTEEQENFNRQIKENEFVFLDKNSEDILYVKNKLIRYQQICSGFIQDKEGNVIQINKDEDNVKLQELLKTVNEIEGKILIWTNFKEEVNIIKRNIKHNFLVYTGEQTTKEKNEIKKRFKEEEDIKCLIINEASGKEGLTLNEADTSIYFSNSFSSLKRNQSKFRIISSESKKNKTIIDICAKGSIDEFILKTLGNKERETNSFFRSLLNKVEEVIE